MDHIKPMNNYCNKMNNKNSSLIDLHTYKDKYGLIIIYYVRVVSYATQVDNN